MWRYLLEPNFSFRPGEWAPQGCLRRWSVCSCSTFLASRVTGSGWRAPQSDSNENTRRRHHRWSRWTPWTCQSCCCCQFAVCARWYSSLAVSSTPPSTASAGSVLTSRPSTDQPPLSIIREKNIRSILLLRIWVCFWEEVWLSSWACERQIVRPTLTPLFLFKFPVFLRIIYKKLRTFTCVGFWMFRKYWGLWHHEGLSFLPSFLGPPAESTFQDPSTDVSRVSGICTISIWINRQTYSEANILTQNLLCSSFLFSVIALGISM